LVGHPLQLKGTGLFLTARHEKKRRKKLWGLLGGCGLIYLFVFVVGFGEGGGGGGGGWWKTRAEGPLRQTSVGWHLSALHRPISSGIKERKKKGSGEREDQRNESGREPGKTSKKLPRAAGRKSSETFFKYTSSESREKARAEEREVADAKEARMERRMQKGHDWRRFLLPGQALWGVRSTRRWTVPSLSKELRKKTFT